MTHIENFDQIIRDICIRKNQNFSYEYRIKFYEKDYKDFDDKLNGKNVTLHGEDSFLSSIQEQDLTKILNLFKIMLLDTKNNNYNADVWRKAHYLFQMINNYILQNPKNSDIFFGIAQKLLPIVDSYSTGVFGVGNPYKGSVSKNLKSIINSNTQYQKDVAKVQKSKANQAANKLKAGKKANELATSKLLTFKRAVTCFIPTDRTNSVPKEGRKYLVESHNSRKPGNKH